MGELDIAIKVLLQLEPEELARLLLRGLPPLRSIRADEAELPALARRMDKLLLFEPADAPEGEEHALALEVAANWATFLPGRVHEVWTMTCAALKHDRVVPCLLLLKRGDKQGEPRNYLDLSVLDRPVLRFQFELVRAWTLDVADLLAGPPALLPLLPYSDGSTIERVEEAIDALMRVDDRSQRADLLGALAVYAGNVYPDVPWIGRIPEELIMESATQKQIAQLFHDKGLAEGQARGLAEGQARGLAEGQAKGLAEGQAKGLAEGQAKGKAKGLAEGQANALEPILRARVGDTATTYLGRLGSASQEVVQQVSLLLIRPLDEAGYRRELDRLLPAG